MTDRDLITEVCHELLDDAARCAEAVDDGASHFAETETDRRSKEAALRRMLADSDRLRAENEALRGVLGEAQKRIACNLSTHPSHDDLWSRIDSLLAEQPAGEREVTTTVGEVCEIATTLRESFDHGRTWINVAERAVQLGARLGARKGGR